MLDPGSLATIGGSLAAPVLSYMGAREANRSNESSAKAAMEVNVKEAMRNREFEERMSNTAHQREVEDLMKAGLNPILAANSGASTPGGSTGSGETFQAENALGAAATSALEWKNMVNATKKLGEELKNMRAVGDNLRADTYKKGVEAEVAKRGLPAADMKNKLYKAVAPVLEKVVEGAGSSAKHIANPVPGGTATKNLWNDAMRNSPSTMTDKYMINSKP